MAWLIRIALVLEVAFRLGNGLHPYEYGYSLPSPLLVALFGVSSRAWPGLEKALLVAIDTLAAVYLWRLARWTYGQSHARLPTICLAMYDQLFGDGLSDSPLHSYLFHPFNLMASAAQSAASSLHLAFLATIYHGLVGDRLLAASWAALATCLSPYAVAIMAPVLAMQPKGQSGRPRVLAVFLVALFLLLGSSWKVSGTGSFFRSTYWSLYVATATGSCLVDGPSHRLTFESLRPNVGLYWYLCTEMFDFFRPFFTSFLQLHVFFYPLPVFIRFR